MTTLLPRYTSLVASAIVLCGVAASAARSTTFSERQGPANPKTASTRPTVLFMCPHGAAKSVLASAYFQRLAKERGLNVRVESAGTEPDTEVAPAVRRHLTEQKYAIPTDRPHKVTSDDIASADIVVSIGCNLRGLHVPATALRTWDDVPSPSENFAAADKAIRKRVLDLVEELVRTQKAL